MKKEEIRKYFIRFKYSDDVLKYTAGFIYELDYNKLSYEIVRAAVWDSINDEEVRTISILSITKL